MKKYILTLLITLAYPVSVFAKVSDFNSLVTRLTDSVLNPALTLLLAAAVLFFLYGVASYVGAGEKAEKRTESIQFMGWGIVAIFVMVSVWGLVSVVQKTFDLDDRTKPTVPQY
ncbi:MAG: hypothetical protein Q8P93_00240 [bacterium]|nr:hypothetical protein [bacterium]